MASLLVLVEGQTEETFVDEVLGSHLLDLVGEPVDVRPRLLGGGRGGIPGWPVAKRQILGHLKQNRGLVLTTMVDYYGLPVREGSAWPGRVGARALPFEQRAESVEAAMRQQVSVAMGGSWNPLRFVPFVVMHEFEALLFSDCALCCAGLGKAQLADSLQAIRDQFPTPEHINDGPLTHPSALIRALVPDYQKPVAGNLAALEIGIPAIAAACPHFADWLHRLESAISISQP